MTKDKKSELKIKAIENGTVIDHITANKALHILKILDLPDAETKNVTVAMNVSSGEIGRKDIVLFATMDANRGESNIERLEEKVKIRGARVVESFTVTTKDKSPEKLVNDTEAIIDAKVLKMYWQVD